MMTRSRGRALRQLDMTQGSPIRLMLQFSAPLVVGNLFQQLYSMTDAAIIGKFIGVDAFAAVGCTSWIIWLITAVCRDCSNAFCIAASLRVGNRKMDEFRTVTGNAAIVSVLLSVLMTGGLLLGLDGILRALQIPANIYADAREYLRIIILSIPLMVIFHMAGALLRAAGNSRVTFVAMTASTVVNIVLDLVFVLAFHWSVAGAAWATLIAQAVTAVIALAACIGKDPFLMKDENWRLNWKILREVGKLWVPMLLNSVIISAGGLYVQQKINAIGSNFTAGTSACTKIFSLLEAVIMAIQTFVSVYVGQNLGADQPERVRSGLRKTVLSALGLTFVLIALVLLSRGRLLTLFLSQEDPAAYEAAYTAGLHSTWVMITGMLIMTPMYLYRVTVQTLGHAIYAMVAGCLQMVVRVCVVEFLPPLWGEYAYYFSDVAAWMVSLPTVMIPCLLCISRLCRKKAARAAR